MKYCGKGQGGILSSLDSCPRVQMPDITVMHRHSPFILLLVVKRNVIKIFMNFNENILNE